MTSSPNPTWYDVLGVSRDASPEQIKAAWRNATDKFEPGSGSGQFRMFNEAADVLLDPPRRTAYDESLEAVRPIAETGRETEVPAPESIAIDDGPAAADPEPDRDRGRWRRPHAVARPVDATTAAADTPAPEPASRALAILTLALALLTVAALVAAAFFGLKVREDARVSDARDEAPASAERAAKAMLSYDYRQLPTDRKRASDYLTDDFRKKYLANFTLLEKQKDGTPGAAVQTKTVVTSDVLGSGVMDASENKVRVLVYVNQTSKKPGVDPQIFQNRVAMTMEKSDGKWLVNDLKSY